jgi:hypothetical protein
MKAKASMTKTRNENGTVVVNLFVENVEYKSELEARLIGLGFTFLGFNKYRGTANTSDQLDAIRKPIIEMVNAGLIEI